MNLVNALQTLGARESGTARLDEAVAAYHEALQENTRDRVPLEWAFTQMNLALVYRALFEKDHQARHLTMRSKLSMELSKNFARPPRRRTSTRPSASGKQSSRRKANDSGIAFMFLKIRTGKS